ncbi:hypothetical protein QL285_078088 [Trifolium repens]|nr:hypothetical protein QL285_078088 [Trifolium repens]
MKQFPLTTHKSEAETEKKHIVPKKKTLSPKLVLVLLIKLKQINLYRIVNINTKTLIASTNNKSPSLSIKNFMFPPPTKGSATNLTLESIQLDCPVSGRSFGWWWEHI